MATTEKDLEVRLLEAHQAGNTRLLEKLQAEFRASGRPVIRYGPRKISLVESRSGSALPEVSTPRVTSIHLANGLRGQIQDLAWEGEDGREAGGFLFGHREGAAVVLTDVSHTARAERSRDEIRLDIDTALKIQRPPFDRIIGTWHTHREGNGDPSEIDRENALRAAKLHRDGINIGIIVTPHPTFGWAAPRLSTRVAQAGKITSIREA
jgi:proteasome lid subunit RPN8/RPN11